MYVKLFSSLYQGTLRGNSHGILVFTNLLAHCDKYGIADIHPRAIAEEVGLSVEDVRVALDELEAPDAESRTPDDGGRRIVRVDEHRAWGWRVVNYAKYRAIKNEDDRREANRLAVAKHRERKSASSHVITGNTKSSVKAQGEGEGEGEERIARKRASHPERPNDVDEQVWQDWLALRKAKRAPVTATTLIGAQAEANKAGMSLDAFLRVWCRRGSQGLEADWLKPNERGQQPSITVPGESVAAYGARMAAEREAERIRVAESCGPPPGLLAMVRKAKK